MDELVDEIERSYRETQKRLSDPAVYNDHREAADVGRRLKELEAPYKLAQEWRLVTADLDAARSDSDLKELVPDLERGRPLELDALLTAVQEMGRIVDLDTPYIDCVLGLTQQMGRIAGVYPAYPEAATITDAEKSIAD